MRRLHTSVIGIALAGLLLAAWAPGASDTSSADAMANICGAERRTEQTTGPKRLPIESGMGDGGFAIRTSSKDAQTWFDYGVKLFHAFYHDDAKIAFDNAVVADPQCAMCLWGQALSRGPTQNFDVTGKDLKDGLRIARAARLVAQTQTERALIDAMIRRYSRRQDAKTERDFASDLLAANKDSLNAIDIQLLASEALLTAWRRGDHSAAPEAIALIEPVLKRDPNNTGAIHYYIHATEFDGRPALALPYAEKLGGLAPKASHLVHMASHTFLRVGAYENAALVNARALHVDADHLIATNTAGALGGAAYYGHNLRFGMAGALMSGDAALALKYADHLHRAFPDKSFAGDGMSNAEGQRYIIYARYAPERMLALPAPQGNTRLIFYHYARGEAFAMTGNIASVKSEAALIKGNSTGAKVASSVLAGRIAMAEKRYADAAIAFETAAKIQESAFKGSMDPPPWWYPVRRSVAAAYLKAGQYDRAAAEVQKSLVDWPADALALTILAQAEEAQKKPDARGHRDEAARAWRGDLSKIAIETI